MRTFVALLAVGGTAVFAAPNDPPVTLHVQTAEGLLVPNSAFELRFAEPMVTPDAVGKPVADSPLSLKPALPGKWIWVSTQSGVFQPDEPPALSTGYQVQLKSDLKFPSGKAIRVNFKEVFNTPAFRVKGWYAADYWAAEDATAKPKIGLCFPANVDLAAATKQLWFVDDKNTRIAAAAEYMDIRKTREVFPTYRSDDKSNLTWAEQYQEFREGKTAKKSDADEESGEVVQRGGPVFRNQLMVTSVKPLPPGSNWRLIAGADLTAETGQKLGTDYPVEVGAVLPFTINKVAPENLVYSGTRVLVEFSKPLSKDVRKEPTKFVKVDPAPAGLKISEGDNLYDDRKTLVFSGKFEVGKDYTLTFAPELAAQEPFTLGQAVTKVVSFSPVPSRLYFQGFAGHQQRSGTRQFNLMGINVKNVKVTAKVIPADKITAALEAYAKYYKEDTGADASEWLQKIDDKSIPGTGSWQKDFVLEGKVDERTFVQLNWDEILGPGKTGAVLVTAEQAAAPAPNVKRVGTQALVQVTDLGLVWKSSGDYFFHAFSMTDAQPVNGATLSLTTADGQTIATTKFAADGTARLPQKKKTGGEEEEAEPKWLTLRNGSDQLTVKFDYDRDQLEFGRFRINVWGDEEDIMTQEMETGGRDRGLLFTDRPVYRPGEKVQVKGILRSYIPAQPNIPNGKTFVFRVKGPREQQIVEQNVTLNEFGAFSTEVQLPRETVGYFRAVLLADAEADEWSGIAHGFTVQEFQPNAFEVKLAVPKTPLIGSPVELPIAAKYYMGKALSKAQVAWTARAADERFSATGFEDYYFTNALNDWRLETKLSGSTGFSAQGRVDIGEAGVANVSFTVPPNTKLPQPRRLRFTTEITDLNQQTVAERAEFVVHSSDFYLGIYRMPEVVREGEPLPIQVIAVRNDGTPSPETIEAEVKLTRIDWQTNRVEEADEADNFRSEPLMQLVGSIPVKTSALVQNGSKWTLAQPEQKDTSFKAEKPGLYLVSAVAKDAGGRDVITTSTVYVYGKDQLAWNYRNRFQVELALDKPEYLPGEQATILVKTPISGPALVTIERENVKRHFFTKLEGNAPAIKVPIEEADAPNVYVSVMVLRGSQDSTKKYKAPEFRVGYTQLKVTRPDAKLYVNVKPAKVAVQPREEVDVICEVKDSEGKAVAGAEVTLWAADEGILSLTGFETPDALAYFTKLLTLDVTTGLTLEKLLGEDPDERAFENKGYLVGGMGKGGDAAVRRNFLGTAFWNANLRTDADGKVNVKFPAPDGLTRYRVMAVTQTKRNQFGHTEAAFEINKPLMLEPAPPRFANVGDKMLLRAVIHNTTPQAGEAVVRMELDSTATASETERKVALAANSSVSVDFPVEFVATGEAKWVWRVNFAAGGTLLQDSVESKFQVVYPTPLLREIRQTRVDGIEADLLAGIDPTLLEGNGVVRVSVSNSRVFELREGVNELLHYPYGCIEQTTSAMMPWLALRDFRGVLPELNKTDEQFNAAVERGIARILSMQTGTGGLSYWPGGDAPEFWASAYGLVGLSTAQKASFAVPESDFARLGEYLSKQLRGVAETDDKWDLSSRAFACYALALAGRPEAAYHEVLFQKRANLTQEARAFLALAIIESQGPAKMADTLLKMRDKAVEEDYWFGSVSRAQAVRLLAWSKLAPKSDGTMAIANALFDQRRGGHWMTTQGNAWAMLGLAEYIRRTEADRKEVKATLAAGDTKTPVQLPAKGGFFEKEFTLEQLEALKLANPGKSRLFTQVKVEVRPKTLVTERTDRGYHISRRYQRINDDGSLSDLGEPQVGDRVLVTLSFAAPAGATYVAIDDPLPAVFEAVNPEFKSQQMNVDLSTVWRSDFTEVRSDRALFFRNSLSTGNHEIRYLARVRASGSATAPPTKIEEMYHPDRFGLSASQVVKAKVLQ